jgi:hypothetical protein
MNETVVNSKIRHELKYYINYFEYLALRSRLKYVLQQDHHSLDDDGYYIRSLYFDDPENSDMHAKQAGLLNRKKIRIRIYNHSDRLIRLEKKSKFNQLIKKEAVQISRQEYEAIISSNINFLREAGTQTSLMFYSEFKRCFLQPKVIVDYKREAYVLPYMGIRVTFDKMLCAGTVLTDLFDPEQIMLKAMESNTVIMEVKYDSILPDYIRSLIQMASRGRTAISKYVLCRELNPSWL